MLLVVEKEQTEDAPHVILQVWIKEIHAPTFFLWRKAAQHQELGIAWQKGFQRMFFDGEVKGVHEFDES